MRLRNIPYAREKISISPYVIQEPYTQKGRIRELFGNANPLYIEIGMGKGQFILEMARQNPDINFIGIEMYSSVVVRAIQKMERLEEEGGAPLNLKFLCLDARTLGEVFEKDEVDKIYLNFSDPWPKDRHAKRRLMSRQFLSLYDQFLKPEGRLEFKTDNRPLFEFALEELAPAGWSLEAKTFDLHHEAKMNQGNIMTEYEQRFSALGNPICKYIIYRK